MKYPATHNQEDVMNDPVMFVLGLLAIGVVVLMLIEHDPRMHDAPTRDEMTTVIPDPFAPVIEAEVIGRRTDLERGCDQPYVAKRFYSPTNYGERTLAIAREKARAFEMLYGVEAFENV
jgi:hypothetical protein